jgi:hypothetical protein
MKNERKRIKERKKENYIVYREGKESKMKKREKR